MFSCVSNINFKGKLFSGDALMNANRWTDNEGNRFFLRQCPRAYNYHVEVEGILHRRILLF